MTQKAIHPPSKEALVALFQGLVSAQGSDLHLKVGMPPILRVFDDLKLLPGQRAPVSAEFLQAVARDLLSPPLAAKWETGCEVDWALGVPGLGRFRMNLFRSKGLPALVARHIPSEIRNLDALGLPATLKKLAFLGRGLVLVTGTAGSGKSTTLAALLNERNEKQTGHIVTIEDPIEYVLMDRKSLITQREVGLDTESFLSGLKSALRQDPDVIMIGEMRDRQTIQAALNAAETGHFVLSTLHTRDAIETVARILGIFEASEQREIRVQLASTLTAIVGQRLLPLASGKGVVVASEILINTPRIKDCLLDPSKAGQILQSMEQGRETYGMQSFDQSLMQLLREQKITREVALRFASNPHDFDLRLRGVVQGTAPASPPTGTTAGAVEESTLELDNDPRRRRK
jgi:twitching motility protein PilT